MGEAIEDTLRDDPSHEKGLRDMALFISGRFPQIGSANSIMKMFKEEDRCSEERKLKARIAELEKKLKDRMDQVNYEPPHVRIETHEIKRFCIARSFNFEDDVLMTERGLKDFFINSIKDEIGEKVLEYSSIAVTKDMCMRTVTYRCDFKVVK